MTPPSGSDDRVLRYDELFDVFRASSKPAEHWCIGVESERFGVRASTGEPIRYTGPGGITEIFEAFEDRFGWAPASEVPGGPVIMLQRGSNQITLEPGCQLELSGAPRRDVHQVHEDTQVHLSELGRVSEGLGLRWFAVGFHPLAHQEELDWVPKLRYEVMRTYLASRGRHALDMMRRTATVQVNLDYADEQDAVKKLGVALRLSPVVAAMFANAPFVEGHVYGGRSLRQLVWFHVDPDRQGLLPRMWNRAATVRDYVEWALDVPMFLIKRDGRPIANTGQTFRAFMRDGYGVYRATAADWGMHLNTLFPEVRLKNVLEMRSADSLPFELMCAIPAMWTGLLYDGEALEQAERLTASWTWEQMEAVREQAILRGPETPFLGRTLAHTAEEVFRIARDGLQRRGRWNAERGGDETIYLDQVAGLVEHGQAPADRLLAGLEHRAGGVRDEILKRVGP